jgi:hypothetical protein
VHDNVALDSHASCCWSVAVATCMQRHLSQSSHRCGCCSGVITLMRSTVITLRELIRGMPCCRHTCVCGALPLWLQNRTDTAGSFINTSCTGLTCPYLPAIFALDRDALLSLKASLAPNSSLDALSDWDTATPPCTWSPSVGSCVPCSTYGGLPCGRVNSQGQLECNWRHVTCRDWRVVGIDTSSRSLISFVQLPPALGNISTMEVFRLQRSQVLSGTLPAGYGSWLSLKEFR